MLHSYFVAGSRPEEVYLNLVLEYVPSTLSQIIQTTKKAKERLHPTIIQLYCFQLFRSLAQIHALGICHRDLKPQNILLNPANHTLKLCDFGSAKMLGEREFIFNFFFNPHLSFSIISYLSILI